MGKNISYGDSSNFILMNNQSKRKIMKNKIATRDLNETKFPNNQDVWKDYIEKIKNETNLKKIRKYLPKKGRKYY